MSLLDGVRYRLAAWLRPGRFARELDEELRFHLALDAMQKEHGARGRLSPDDARYAALREFGSVVTHTEEARHVAGLSFLDVLAQDLRFALRAFRRTPGFTLVAVLTLAVGIGATTAIFSAVNALLLRPLPFREPERLMRVTLVTPAFGDWPAHDDMVWSWPKAQTFREAQRVFSDVTTYTDVPFTLRGGGEAERAFGEVTDDGYFRTLGVPLALGRGFTAEENRAGAAKVAVLADALWQRRFNADPRVLGKTLDVDGAPYVIVGVAPAGFRGLSGKAELWVPVVAAWGPEMATAAWSHALHMIARLAPGVTPERAAAVVPELGRLVDGAWPDPDMKGTRWGAKAGPLDATRVSPVVRRSLLVLMGAVALVLLVACANVANLFLVRAAGRRREIAVRLAVGAGRARLVRQLLTESVLLAAFGGAAGLLVAFAGARALGALNPEAALRGGGFGNPGGVQLDWIRLDLSALGFAALVTIGTGLLFGLVPALRATRLELTGALKDDRAGGGGRRALTGRGALAVLEIALALVLLAGSGLMLRSLANLLGVRPGFASEHVLTLRLNSPDGAKRETLPAFWQGIVERVAAVPGVTTAAVGNCPPLSGGCNGTVALRRDRPKPAPGAEPAVGVQWITPEWLGALQVPLLRGRNFTAADRAGAHKVVLVSQTAAKRIWGTEDPLGKPVSVGQGGFWEDTATVVGVVGDVRFGRLDEAQQPDVYLSYAQSPYPRGVLFVRTSGDPLALVRAIRAAVRTAAPDSPIYDVKTLETLAAEASASARFSALLLGLFAAVALALATLGVYGVVSYGVAQRTKEIGVRVALGATRGHVLRLVVGQGAAIVVVGGALGLGGAVAATRVLRSLLYEVAPGDPLTLAAVALLLGLVVLAACLLPARRAASIAPTEALRE